MKSIFYSICLIMMLLILFIAGCSNDSTSPVSNNSQGNGSLKLYLIDSVNEMDSVVICVKRVDVHSAGSDSTSGWITLNDSLRYFDLLQLTNGIHAVLSNTQLAAGHYTQIRLFLADSNYIVDTNGIKYHLTVPSGMQTGIKLNNSFTIKDGSLYELFLDFDANKSVKQTGNGVYKLVPVIRVVALSVSGTVAGQILPLDANANISAVSISDTISTFTLPDGTFLLTAVPAGTYDFIIQPSNFAYSDTTISGINVFANSNINLGIITLKNR
jgi:Domain of unknown function (DUF4382)